MRTKEGGVMGGQTDGERPGPPPIANGHGPPAYSYLRRLCRDRGLLFEDPEFPPSHRALSAKNKFASAHITWMRPFEICARPKFISEGSSRFDVEQGELGDCWLLAAISCLSNTARFLDRVVPSDQGFGAGYCGLFRFRFWKFGEWTEVIIDDRLPTHRGRLVYMHSSDPSEFWAALLEKAYAKFYGGYDQLQQGYTGRALQDLTGGVAQTFQMANIDSPTAFAMVSSAVPRSTLMAACIIPEHSKPPARLNNGLYTQHAYSVTGIAKVRVKQGEVTLIRLRNPWGRGEWNGPWSDRSWEWDSLSERDRQLLGVRQPPSEGEFWMSFDDFTLNYTHLDLVHIGPDDWMQETALHSKKPWRAVLARRRWRRGYNAGGGPCCPETTSCNPQFHVQIPKSSASKCHMVVSVTQQYSTDAIKEASRKLHPVGFAIYEVPPQLTRLTSQFVATHRPLDVTVHSTTRETVTFFTLPAGDYIVLPCTSNINCETRFLLRIFTDEHSNVWEVNDDNLIYRSINFAKNGNVNSSHSVPTTYSKIAHKLPPEVDAYTLLKLLRAMSRKNLCLADTELLLEKPSLELCRHLVMLKDPIINGKINAKDVPLLLGMLHYWRNVFVKFDPPHKGRTSSFNLRPLLWEAGITVSNKVLECLVIRYAKECNITAEAFIGTLVKLYLAHDRYIQVEKKLKENTLSLEEMILMTVYS
ncbi:calpain-9-like isoform X2 [Ornithodoros turicata]|uniref:calpain-9-like isoform X2 n=1 Tax=Ornithodoros turicata TaxID=34597 RepID=UPI00313A4D85